MTTNETTKPENIVEIIESLTAESGTSSKTGKPYRYLQIQWTNGYTHRIFLDDAQWYMVDALSDELNK